MIGYHIYWNAGTGGPVDLTTPYLTTTNLTVNTGALTYPGDYTFLVRAYDTVSGLEESNVVARFRLVLDGSGNAVGNRPRPPVGLSARPGASGEALLTWAALPRGPHGSVTSYRVYGGSPSVIYTTPLLTVPVNRTSLTQRATVTGLTPGSSYEFAVRAVNGAGEEANALTVALTLPSAPPDAVEPGGSEAVPWDRPALGFPPLPPP